ncbi:MAG: DUF5615 family PIN-like protein [Mongoliitalea sp.]
MPKFLIDVNLPYYFSTWNNSDYIHQIDLGDSWTDNEIWEYAKKNNLTIITKDTDFFNKIILSTPPPKVIHLKFGNMKLKEFHKTISIQWPDVLEFTKECKLVVVFSDRIEAIKD